MVQTPTDWIEHGGGPCPVSNDTFVFVRQETGKTDEGAGSPVRAGWWADANPEACNWQVRNGEDGIVAYRVVQS